MRLLRIQTLAEETFDDKNKANLWLRRPLTGLDGETPLVIAQTARNRDHPREDRVGRRGVMRLWRLSGARHAKAFDGGYGMLFDGRWNTVGHAVTYCSTSPSLCVLEKLVHIEDPALLPQMVMVSYEVPAGLGVDAIGLEDLPEDWRRREAWTQRRGDDWHERSTNPLLRVPSALALLADSPDVNFLVNHNHPGSVEMRIGRSEPFAFDPRLLDCTFAPGRGPLSPSDMMP